MNKITTWILVIVALIVGFGAGFLIERQRATDKMESYKLEAQKMVDSAKMEVQKLMVSPTVSQSNVVVMKKDAKLGSIGADAKGMTLYTYDKDTAGVSNCTNQCATIWPPYVVTGTAPANLPLGITLIKRADGSMQYADQGKPLYTYTKDKDAKDVYGDGVGGVWHVVK